MRDPQVYPLDWPIGEPRATRRVRGKFEVQFGRARDELLRELRLLGARDVVISSNVPTRRDGLPYADAPKRLSDPGVAVYWTAERWDAAAKRYVRTPFVMACDKYDSPVANIRALGLSVEAIRSLERHGTRQLRDRAFSGFAALPAVASPPSRSVWWRVLGLSEQPVTEDEVNTAYRARAKHCHPDHGGSDEAMAELNRARDEAIAFVRARGGA